MSPPRDASLSVLVVAEGRVASRSKRGDELTELLIPGMVSKTGAWFSGMSTRRVIPAIENLVQYSHGHARYEMWRSHPQVIRSITTYPSATSRRGMGVPRRKAMVVSPPS